MREFIIQAVKTELNLGFSDDLDLIIDVLEKQKETKQVLRDKGYGWTGLSLLKTVQEEVGVAHTQ